MRQFLKEVNESQLIYTEDGEILEGDNLWTKYPATVIYSAYRQWCIENGLKPWNQKVFGREIQKELNLELFCPNHKQPTFYRPIHK